MVYIVPPSAALLDSCPQFESLNKKLTLSLLDQDGAVKSECLSNSHTESELCHVQQYVMKECLLRESIQSLVLSDKLPPEIRRVLAQNCVLPALESNMTSLVTPRFESRSVSEADTSSKSSNTHSTPPVSIHRDLSARLRDIGCLDNVSDPEMSNRCRERAQGINQSQKDEVERLFVVVTKVANDVVKLLGALLEHSRHGHAERFLRLLCSYLVVVSNGLRSKLTRLGLFFSLQQQINKHLGAAENQLIQDNLHDRGLSLERSLLQYKQGGPAFESLVQEYLRTHFSILQCEREIEDLKAAKANTRI